MWRVIIVEGVRVVYVSGGGQTPSERGPHAAGDQMFAEGQKSPPPVYFRAPEVNGRRRMGK